MDSSDSLVLEQNRKSLEQSMLRVIGSASRGIIQNLKIRETRSLNAGAKV
jgi:hypothetical protein